ncbi:hypothetical protein CEXT_432671 [Caerostris extrusa]|uniref:Uncharacterized protein n=1 Tax=Caerostris extrusa TaxID=172846 RepID=A0AAV4NKC4_CAEEX|nr:hypothetical protein CEXT_432671 [Caerostris extrusa]
MLLAFMNDTSINFDQAKFSILLNALPALRSHARLPYEGDHLPVSIDIELNRPPHTAPQHFKTNWHDYNFKLQNTNLNTFNIDTKEKADMGANVRAAYPPGLPILPSRETDVFSSLLPFPDDAAPCRVSDSGEQDGRRSSGNSCR